MIPKPIPKKKKTFDWRYWREVKIKSMKKSMDKNDERNKKLVAFYLQVWNSRRKASELTGYEIYHTPPVHQTLVKYARGHIHHVFEKNIHKFPELIFDPDYAVMVTFNEHHIIHFGTDAQRRQIGYDKYLKKVLRRVQELPESKLKERMLDELEDQLSNK